MLCTDLECIYLKLTSDDYDILVCNAFHWNMWNVSFLSSIRWCLIVCRGGFWPLNLNLTVVPVLLLLLLIVIWLLLLHHWKNYTIITNWKTKRRRLVYHRVEYCWNIMLTMIIDSNLHITITANTQHTVNCPKWALTVLSGLVLEKRLLCELNLIFSWTDIFN